MAREKVDNKLNVVIGTKVQIEGDPDIPENSIVIVTDEELQADEINYSVGKSVKKAIEDLGVEIEDLEDNKVDKADIVDDLTTNDTDKPLSANQGKVLNDTTAKLGTSNVFTQPQIVPKAVNDNQAVNLGQLKKHGNMVNVTYQELVDLRDNEELVAGTFYRITDYETTTVQAETRSAGHPFDVIVQALDEKTLSENASAAHRRGPSSWFEHSKSDPVERYFYVDSIVIEGLTLYRWVSEEELNNESNSQYLLTETRSVDIGDVVWGWQSIDDNRYDNTSEDYEELDEQRTIINVGGGDTPGLDYFANSKLEAWKLKYCLDNDTDRFVWADEVNGKGVIYRMIDEFNNDVPYDFKNIQFKRKLTDGEYDEDAGTETWVYTFTGISYEHHTLIDGTVLKASEYFTDEVSNLYKNNKIGIYEYKRYQEDGNDKIIQECNNIVFIGSYNEEPYGEEGPAKIVLFSFNNTLGSQCYNMTFGHSCYYNTIGNDSYSNTIGNYFYYNAIGNNSYDNTIGNHFTKNTIGNHFANNTIDTDFGSNTIGNDFVSNTIGKSFHYNTIGNGFGSNTIGNGFGSNTIGNSFHYNTIGNDFVSNTIGNDFYYNTIGNSFHYNTIGNFIRYIQFSVDGNPLSVIRNLYIKSGLTGASSANKLDLYYAGLYGREYPTTIELIANGNIISSWEATPLIRTGKVKATNTTATWSDIPANFYTRTEIDNMIGNIEDILDDILGV